MWPISDMNFAELAPPIKTLPINLKGELHRQSLGLSYVEKKKGVLAKLVNSIVLLLPQHQPYLPASMDHASMHWHESGPWQLYNEWYRCLKDALQNHEGDTIGLFKTLSIAVGTSLLGSFRYYSFMNIARYIRHDEDVSSLK